jgi:hypothetical protein
MCVFLHPGGCPGGSYRLVGYFMKKLILHAALTFFTILCASEIAGAMEEQRTIDFESIQYVEIMKNNHESKRFRLSNSQAQELTKRWNQAHSIGLCKFYAKYIITVRAKNGETRTFRATEDTIKERNDICFLLQDRYIEAVWKTNQ